MDLDFGCLLLFGCQLVLLQFCESQTNACSQNGDVRLENGAGPYEGRVEICYSGVWKTVCHYWWDYSAAMAVCAQLHYPPQDALALDGASFGQGNGSIILEYIHCSGSELKLIDCSFIPDYYYHYYYYYCNHAEDAGVRCLSCNAHGAVRLRGSSSQNRGRVEICVNGVWGTVCDDDWDSTDASVVCGQLGFSRFGSRGYSGAPYGPGRGPIHLDDVRCTGNEQDLIDCTYTNNTFGSDCTHGEDAAVYCQPTLQCEEGDLRLTKGSINYGIVEVCMNETWGTICSTNWGQSEATVTCRQLGFSGLGASAWSYGSVSEPVHYSNILCTGSELWLIDCQRDSYNIMDSCNFTAGAYCSFDYLSSPVLFQVKCEESNLCTLSWQPPPIDQYSRRQGSIMYYSVNCFTTGATREHQVTYTTPTYVTLGLQPYQFYNCCVAAVNEIGRGKSSCQAIITHQAAPTAAPINLEAYQLNSTSAFLLWSPPLVQYQNGIIQGYYIYVELNSTDEAELSEVNSTETMFDYTTEDQYLLMNNLQPFAVYTCRVAAYTVERGPFSESLTFFLLKFSAPTAAPTNIKAHQLNSMSIFLSWSPPFAQYQNGIIRGYYVYVDLNSTEAELSDANSTTFEYTTQDQHLLVDSLHPFVVYTCRVAAYTVERGPFSEPLTVVLSREEESDQSQGTDTTITVATVSTLLVAVIIMVGACFAMHMSYKLAKRKKRYRHPDHNVHDHEAAEDPKLNKPVENTLKERNSHTCTSRENDHNYHDDPLTLPVPPRTYSLRPSKLNKIDNVGNLELQDLNSQAFKDRNPRPRVDDENTYQPLIPPRHSNNTTRASEYQSLTQFKQHQSAEAKI